MTELEKVNAYSSIYLYSIVPIISVSGIFLAYFNHQHKYRKLVANGINPIEASRMIFNVPEATKPNLLILIGSIMFVIFTLAVGTSNIIFLKRLYLLDLLQLY